MTRMAGYTGDTTLARRLLRWYRRNRRDLPWRRTRAPYAIWLSEVMLQQTQVATVVPYYLRFLKRFPTVESLAESPLDDVLRMWSGLGYYHRARNLHAAAKKLVADDGGRWPRTVEELRGLPGVGDYTAAAVASIAFGRRAAVVDGNVARVLARLLAIKSDVRNGSGKRRMQSVAERILPRRAVGDFNQALMELGATVCTPAAPRCEQCPLRSDCQALARGLVDVLPHRRAARAVPEETYIVLAVRRGSQWLFRRRPDRGRWAGLWELPSEMVNGHRPRLTVRRLLMEMGLRSARPDSRPFCRFRHQLTHRTITFVGYLCTASPARPRERFRTASGSHCWRTLDAVDDLGMARPMHRLLAELRAYTGRFSAITP